ncbi:MAG: hypothetical protein ACQER9_00835 [Nanobdellota archaeon]
MKLKFKNIGLLFDKKYSKGTQIKELSLKKNPETNEKSVQIFYKGKNSSGIVELTEKEIKQINSIKFTRTK